MIFAVRSAGAVGCAAALLLAGCTAPAAPRRAAPALATPTPTPIRTGSLAPSPGRGASPTRPGEVPGSSPSAPLAAGRPAAPATGSRAAPPSVPSVPSARVDPLTGLAPAGAAPVVVLKVDNGPLARPYQRGLSGAVVVYQELIEGGSTRFIALYDDGYAGEVGPIRSVRESDAALLGQYGPVALGFSGGNTGVKAGFRAAVLGGRILDASYDRLPGIYRLGEQRADARNFFTSPAKVAAAVPGATRVRPAGLRFWPVASGSPVSTATASFVAGSTVRVHYLPADGVWQVFQDGRLMPGYTPTNIVLQQVQVPPSRYVDVRGSNTPYTVTIGSGPVSVLRGGLRVDGWWQRANVSGVTRYLDGQGRDLRLKPGSTLVLLVPAGRALTVG